MTGWADTKSLIGEMVRWDGMLLDHGHARPIERKGFVFAEDRERQMVGVVLGTKLDVNAPPEDRGKYLWLKVGSFRRAP